MDQLDFIDQVPGFILVTRGPGHRVEYVNRAHQRLFGSETWIDRNLADIAGLGSSGAAGGVNGAALCLATVLDVAQTGRRVDLQDVSLPVPAKDGGSPRGLGDAIRTGDHRIFNIVHAPLHNAQGVVDGVIIHGTDITDIKRAQRRDGVMADLGELIRNINDPDDLAYAAAELLGRDMNVSRAGYGTVDTRNETIRIERDWNAPGIQTLAGTLRFRDYGSYIEDLKRGETAVVVDAYGDPRTALTADALKAISAQAFVNMPVTEEGGIVALLYLNHAEARSWSEDDLALIRQVADRTRTAVERRRVEVQLRDNEARLTFLDHLGRETAQAVEADEILRITTRMMGAYLGVSNCAYADMEPDEDHFTIRGDWCAPETRSIQGYYSLADFGTLAVENLQAGRPLVLNDTGSELPLPAAAVFLAMGLAATICMPLVKEGRLTALMAIHDRVPRVWKEPELALLREVTERSWAHIERVRSQRAGEETAERLRLATEAASIGIWDYDLETGALRWDERCKALFGLPADAEVTYEETFLPGLHPDDREKTDAAVRKALATPADSFEIDYRTIGARDGRKRWLSANGSIHQRDGVAVRFIGTSTLR